MTRNDEIIHPHERAGRAEKVAALVHTIDRYNDRADEKLRIDIDLIADSIENDVLWRILAGIAGVRIPSLRTRQAVEAELRTRANVEQMLADGIDPFEGIF